MFFRQIHDDSLAQYAYLIGCQRTGEALLVDPERDIDRYLDLAAREGLRITAVAETHIHADFLSGARDLADRTGARLFLSADGAADGWQARWAEGRDDVTWLHDGDAFRVGNIEIRAVHTPGHTPEHLSFLVTDHGSGATAPMGMVSGDFVFVGDLGRPDLLESAAGVAGAQRDGAARLHASALAFLDLDDGLQVWPGHGAGSACGKALGAVPQTTVGYERQTNAALDAARHGREAFVDAILDGQPEPPLYFARMKRLNRDGVPPLSALPAPRRLDAANLGAALADLGAAAVVLDTRPDRLAFMAAHLPGALHTPRGAAFATVAGSLVAEHEAPLVLVARAADVDALVRALARIGLDRVAAFVTPETVADYAAAGGEMATIDEVDFAAVAAHRHDDGVVVLDVRRAAEYAAGHVPGALNIAHTRLADRAGEIDLGAEVYVHCQSGVRSAYAAAYLARAGWRVHYVNDAFPRFAALDAAASATTA